MENEDIDIELKRPTCSCGAKMTYVIYVGYYDAFEFWECKNNNCTAKIGIKPDEKTKGSYA